MNNNILIQNYLSVLKSNVEVFVHGTLESSYGDTQKLLNKCLNDTINCQRDTYKCLVELGVYKVEDVETNKICKTIKKLNQ